MTYKPLILTIEDDKAIRSFIQISLESQGYKCLETESGMTGISMIFSHQPDVVLLDLGLRDIDGIDIIKKIRVALCVPIIVVSARGHDQDKVEALDAGADDYLTKPFSVAELLARIRVALRHKAVSGDLSVEAAKQFSVGDLLIDYEKHKTFLEGKEVHLTPIEFKLLALLSMHAGKVLTHNFIIKEIWGGYCDSDTQSLRVFMANIRRKIEKNSAKPIYLLTEVGIGYRLNDEVS